MVVTTEEIKTAVHKAFVEIDRAVRKSRGCGGFGRGYSMHEAARSVAPEWLRKWDDDKKWLLCFTQGVSGLEIMSKAFGMTKDGVYDQLKPYYTKWKEQQ